MSKYFSLILRLWKILKPFHKDFYIQLGSTIVQQGITVFTIYILAKALDAIVHLEFDLALTYILYNLVAMLTKAIIGYFTEIHAQNNIGYAIQQHLEEY